MRNLTLIVALLFLAGCAKIRIMDASAVSMTKKHKPAGRKLKEKGPVTGMFCSDSDKDEGTIGLMDEAIRNAQKKHKVDFILDARFFNDGSCVTVEGTGAKL